MFYYLDKAEILENHLPKMYYKSENGLNEKEKNELLKQCIKKFGYITLVEYEADCLPNHLYLDEQENAHEYISINTFSEEKLLDETKTLSKEDMFGEEDNNNYVYIDKEECLKNYSPCVCRVSKGKRLLNYKELYDGNVLEYIGENMADLPNEVIYNPETDLVRGMTEYEKVKYKKRELFENEVILEKKKEIVSIFEGQYVDENENIVTVPKLEDPNAIVQEWDSVNHVWIDKTTNLDVVQNQYKEYEGMDTPSTLEEMKQQDPAMATEYINMMIELRGLIYTLSASEPQPVGYSAIHIPQPSEALKNFKNKFKKV